MTHLIRQQFLHVDFEGSEHEALALQRRLQRFCHADLIPAMELALDRHGHNDVHCRLERLELELGTLPVERLEYDLAGAISRALERSLHAELTAPGADSRQRPVHGNVTDAFLHFLETGSLPWWFRLPEGSNLEGAVLGCLKTPPRPGEIVNSLRRYLPKVLACASPRKRLTLQFTEPFLEAMVSMIFPAAAHALAALLDRLRERDVPPPLLSRVKLTALELVLVMPQGEDALDLGDLATGIRHLLPPGTLKEIGIEDEPAPPANGAPDAASGAAFHVEVPLQLPAERHDTPRPAVRVGSDRGCGTDIAAREGWYIENAGLVLLHPFLPRLFAGLHIAAGNGILQPERALCLLHYLATGALKAPEYELLLPKLLCGVDLRVPVASEVGLTQAERAECTALLEAVVAHWDALGNSSADALRGTFLLRPGKLSQREDGDWLLQVESSGFDILLDRLPWATSFIKLPWMDQTLWVEWNA